VAKAYKLDKEQKKTALRHKRIGKNTPDININLLSYQYFEGVDLLAIEGVIHSTILILMNEASPGIHKFETAM